MVRLRIVAALKWIYGKDFTWSRVEANLDNFSDTAVATTGYSTIDLELVSEASYFFYLQTAQVCT